MFKAVRILIDSEAPIPIADHAYHRQIIARVRTKQTLEEPGKLYKAGTSAHSRTATLDEYVVIQRMIIEGKDEKWMIWGTTQPATLKQIDTLLEEAPTEKFRDRFSEQFQRWSGNAPSM